MGQFVILADTDPETILGVHTTDPEYDMVGRGVAQKIARQVAENPGLAQEHQGTLFLPVDTDLLATAAAVRVEWLADVTDKHIWHPVHPYRPELAADIGGDGQTTEAYSVRFARWRSDKTWAQFTVYFYGLLDEQAYGDKPVLVEHREYQVGRNLMNLGDTEEFFEYRITAFNGAKRPVVHDSTAKEFAERFTLGRINWDGREFYPNQNPQR